MMFKSDFDIAKENFEEEFGCKVNANSYTELKRIISKALEKESSQTIDEALTYYMINLKSCEEIQYEKPNLGNDIAFFTLIATINFFFITIQDSDIPGLPKNLLNILVGNYYVFFIIVSLIPSIAIIYNFIASVKCNRKQEEIDGLCNYYYFMTLCLKSVLANRKESKRKKRARKSTTISKHFSNGGEGFDKQAKGVLWRISHRPKRHTGGHTCRVQPGERLCHRQ